jgi:hypothetical protein
MPVLDPIRVFISHAWGYNDEYYAMQRHLLSAPDFPVQIVSSPEHDRLDNRAQLEEKLRGQMAAADVVVVLAGLFVAHGDWLQHQLGEAARLGKPIIAVKPWSRGRRVPAAVQAAATVVHDWQTDLIVGSIRALARSKASTGTSLQAA